MFTHLRRQLLPALAALLAFTILTGGLYPLVVTGAAQAVFPGQARGDLVERGGQPAGSRLIGQRFTRPGYFHPRPSAAGYDPAASGGTNLGPTSDTLRTEVSRRVAAYRAENHLGARTPVPVDAVTASGSGLDPDISVANARLQAPRVADARGLTVATVLRLVGEHTARRPLGVLGEPAVNVLELNLALDDLAGR